MSEFWTGPVGPKLDVSHLPTDKQVARATGDPSVLDTHSGFSTEALRELSMDTSWLDAEIGSVDELGWYALMGRYILEANMAGFYACEEFLSVDAAKASWEDLEDHYAQYYGERESGDD